MKAIRLSDFCNYDGGKPDFWPEWWTWLRVNIGGAIIGRTNLIVLVEGHARLAHGAPGSAARAAELVGALNLAISRPTPYVRARSDGHLASFWHGHNNGVDPAECVGCRLELALQGKRAAE
ncbi:hypothetical protein UFOVP1383_5 [uncultured Caudovirales phage]|uniref:Uncharacterized protein n=1 Tax=uncultured Caudovirales phage TaxID=2100421 RepID=A0A6J5PCB5_9CAUD|nr:hypothetical protein UFOVP848_36 [uncultured Caudovirales phage]CAB4173240.1 hypothetical protein UFOVP945_29 [uncultured Caudovirales phage]CAB4179609.1 hypothetical protein UFOVP1023_13 [uncultured Caudovirales phage]CAB4203798.1 hypothetical protein UFOVP1383_5 [uncultured Caudovirales phage]CAB4216019.1 hypothetical protein UFOVP1477_43 [uncultured Caudovirales phage]